MSDRIELLYRALLDAFPSEGPLERMLRFRMGLSLAEIASGNLADQVFAVVKYAESRGLVDKLIQAALAANPDNQALRAVSELGASKDGVPPPAAGDGHRNVDKRSLRQIIQDSYSLEELEVLCADLEEQLNARGQALSLSLEDLSGATKQAKVLSLIEFLDRRRLLNALVDMVRQQRPDRF